ncbi:flagellar assembly peptidoglycan hydrolase FlgJ [Legionella micdadei]|nr:flagellar assembly peptidoglycan hydrolase FlgJ [Legionella micdadei]ARG98894.1 flagellar rod assembly protein/muramidase FlgJ [Legionella micdadei]ARH01571.1 flagellar rod assembly protein/muramidase FlgJ [Legionella micdadei]KTD28496.1 muramidase, peptidoglycan hydrolase FlgJ [Legionella micdadei]NSL18735.1 flagellar assembly peptidoglycan hydrolase FlgJ [Legionella micdadei]SCX83376.1 flagellar protein FlgJ [Legionella micdadei]
MAIEGIAVSDFQSLQELRAKAQKDPDKALPEVAKQFEAIFLQSMLKSMRMGQHFLEESNPFRGKSVETFQEMLDAQYATNITQGQGIGLATMLAKQLSKSQTQATMPQTEINAINSNTPKTLNALNDPKTKVEQSLLPARIAPKQPVAVKETVPNPQIDDFVRSAWPYARQAANLLGLDPKILLAQAALETGWGQFIAKDADGSSSYNFFNIKAADNNTDAVHVNTTEYIADTPIKVNAAFKKYASIENSFNDYVSLIKDSNRYGDALANTRSPERYIDELYRAGYATDPHYASKILAIYHGDELQHALERNGFSELA